MVLNLSCITGERTLTRSVHSDSEQIMWQQLCNVQNALKLLGWSYVSALIYSTSYNLAIYSGTIQESRENEQFDVESVHITTSEHSVREPPSRSQHQQGEVIIDFAKHSAYFIFGANHMS